MAPKAERFAGTLGFLGNRLPDREARVHEFFLRAAELLPDQTVLCLAAAGGTTSASPALTCATSGHVYSRDHSAFNARARAVLNVNRA